MVDARLILSYKYGDCSLRIYLLRAMRCGLKTAETVFKNLDDLVEQTADESVETGSVLVFGDIQDGGEAWHEAVDERRDAFRVAGQASQRLQ